MTLKTPTTLKTRRYMVQSLAATGLFGFAACANGQSQAPSQAPRGNPAPGAPVGANGTPDGTYDEAVSYTHLPLPTIGRG